ncbi:MAG: ferric-dicitrate binding protein FerR (iron transport regulator) [Rhodothermales bacterium]|jgi:ferric-dicitrate binding protein FerR (iron transport regulator)
MRHVETGMNERWHDLIARLQIGQISDAEFAELEATLKDSSEARALFRQACRIDAQLQRQSEGLQLLELPTERPKQRGITAWLAAAVVVLAAALLWLQTSRPAVIGTIASAEEAAWQSALPTELGSELTKGELTLASGIAMIRFRSGAELTLEGPAVLSLESPMRARLRAGVAIVEVPESAHGFVLETPNGHVVDYGTKFAVDVDLQGKRSNFELIEGEIAVHHPLSGNELRLVGRGKMARIADGELLLIDGELEQGVELAAAIRIGTNGRATSVHRQDRKKAVTPELLSVKRTNMGKHDQRAFFAFDLSAVDLDAVATAQLRLNLVPSTRGFAGRLPVINQFGVYGLTNAAKADWKVGCLWAEAPSEEDGTLLGTFRIKRSMQPGSVGIDNAELLEFLRAHRDGSVTLILVRQTTQIEGAGPGMTHTFASDFHPEAVGPLLEFSLEN